jgi:two-component system invasion response regulator UvrY
VLHAGMAGLHDTSPDSPRRAEVPGRVGVLVVDDHVAFREAARELVEATPGFVMLDEASSGDQALALANQLEPDLMLVDVWMPDMDGLATASLLHAAHPGTVVILVSAGDWADLPRDTASCGAAETVRKQDLTSACLRSLWRRHGS